MPTGFEEISLAYKIAGLALEIGRSASNQIKTWRNDSQYRILSSLTTMEFVVEGGDVMAHFVQDRIVKITRDDVRMPPFNFGTDGKDVIDHLTVTTGTTIVAHKPRILEQDGSYKVVGTEDDVVYDRNAVLRCVLTATSLNGFPKMQEDYWASVEGLVDTSTIFIIFPSQKPARDVNVRMRNIKDSPGTWRTVSREKNEMRQFTRDRQAFILEMKNPPIGHKYKISWSW